MAAAFDADAAAERGQAIGDGTPVHLTIPTDNPWVPLRILALGKSAAETVQADVYLLTDERPALLPNAGAFGESAGLILDHSDAASDEPPHRPALRRRHGVGPGRRVADEGRHRRDRRRAELRPRHRRVRRGRAVADRRGLRAVPTDAGSSRSPIALYLGLAAMLVVAVPIGLERATRGGSGRPPLAGA